MRRKKDKIPKHPFKFLLYISKPYKKLGFYAVICTILASSLNATFPYIFKQIIDTINTIDPKSQSTLIVLFWVLMFPIANLLANVFYRLTGIFSGRFSYKAEVFAYKKLFSYLSKHSQSFFDDRFAGSLVGKISTASSSSQSVLEQITWTYIPAFITIVSSLIYASTIKPVLALIFLIFILILIPVNLYIVKFRRIASQEETEAKVDLTGKTVDVSTNMLAVRQFAMRKEEIGVIFKLSDKYLKTMIKSMNLTELILFVNGLLISILMLISSIITYTAWKQGLITAGDFVLILTVLSRIIYDLLFIGLSMNYVAKNYGEIEESLNDMIIGHDVKDIKGAKDLDITDGKVEFRDVFFNYDKDQAIFENLNISINPNEKVGIIGPSGSGKTTLIRLLLRQHDVTGGGIFIDEQNISKVTQDSLHEQISIVPQEPVLFHRSIKENIAYGDKDAKDSDIVKAAKLAEAHDFIIKTSSGYDTLVGERGVKLSAGQRQRIAIARAILKKSKVLILDEATSALDSQSEVLIQKALHNLMSDKTVLAIAHRLSTLSEMDRIIVVKNGEIIEDGSHKELINRNGFYKKLWDHQAGGFLSEDM